MKRSLPLGAQIGVLPHPAASRCWTLGGSRHRTSSGAPSPDSGQHERGYYSPIIDIVSSLNAGAASNRNVHSPLSPPHISKRRCALSNRYADDHSLRFEYDHMSAPAIVDDSILDDAADARACRKIGVRGRKALIAKLFFDGCAPVLALQPGQR